MSSVKKTHNNHDESESEMGQVLGIRALNRALLARQMLLNRVTLPTLDAIEFLVGIQAQSPNAPYYGLWTRLKEFKQEDLCLLIQNKKAVRMALMRSTLHLVSAEDCLALRPWVQSVQERSLKGAFGKDLIDINTLQLASAGRTLVESEPLTFHEIGKRLQEKWPDNNPAALSAAIRTLVPLVQLPPRGLWGESSQAIHTSAETWLGRPLSSETDENRIILRYLAAYGPATIKDIQVWSGLTRLRETIESLRPYLVTFLDDQGYELFDLPDAPRPDPKIPSPPRFLGEFDNVLLSHSNRNRILDESHRKLVFTKNGIIRSTFLIDGFVTGTWQIQRERNKTTLVIEPFRQLSQQEHESLNGEGYQLLNFTDKSENNKDIVFSSIRILG